MCVRACVRVCVCVCVCLCVCVYVCIFEHMLRCILDVRRRLSQCGACNLNPKP